MNNDLMQKLAISKKIMDASDRIKPGQAQATLPTNENVNATYNIPQEMLQESQVPQQPKMPQAPTMDRIANSKLPDDIKKLIDRYRTIGAAAGSLFVFKGKYRAVLINYPNRAEKEALMPT